MPKPVTPALKEKGDEIILSKAQFQALIDRIHLLEDIVQSEADFVAGNVMDGKEFKCKIMSRFRGEKKNENDAET